MAAGTTYSPIATTTLASAVGSYTFSSIPTTYTDLIFVMNLTAGGTNFDVQVGNGSIDAGGNYSSRRMYATGSSVVGDGQNNNTTGFFGNITNSSALTTTSTMVFNSYSNTSTYKVGLGRFSGGDASTLMSVGSWRSTAAINTIKISSTSGNNIPAGSTLTIYGIASA